MTIGASNTMSPGTAEAIGLAMAHVLRLALPIRRGRLTEDAWMAVEAALHREGVDAYWRERHPDEIAIFESYPRRSIARIVYDQRDCRFSLAPPRIGL